MAAAPRSDSFGDPEPRADELRARLREARAEADRYEADPTSPEAMARAEQVIYEVSRLVTAPDIDVSVGDDGSIDFTFWSARRLVAVEAAAPTGSLNALLMRREDRSVVSELKDAPVASVVALVRSAIASDRR